MCSRAGTGLAEYLHTWYGEGGRFQDGYGYFFLTLRLLLGGCCKSIKVHIPNHAAVLVCTLPWLALNQASGIQAIVYANK